MTDQKPNDVDVLQQENARLQKIVDGMDASARMLVRRDLELRRANESLQELDKEKSEFVSIAAHQLRTPLSAIKWSMEMLMQGELGPVTDEQLTIMNQSKKSVNRMVKLVNDLLGADHLEFGQVSYHFVDIDIQKAITYVCDELRPMADEQHIELVVHKTGKPIIVKADTDRIKEAFLNVVNNAIKYTSSEGKVTVRVTSRDHMVEVSIADTGIGIPKKDQRNLFKKFARADNAKKVDANGTGLGLFIVHKIIEAHHGTITYSSDEGKGTTFRIMLPVVEHIDPKINTHE